MVLCWWLLIVVLVYYSSFSRFGGYDIMMRSIFRRKKGVESYFAKLSSNFLLVDTSLDKEEPSCWSRNVLLIVSKTISESSFSNTCKKKKRNRASWKKGRIVICTRLIKKVQSQCLFQGFKSYLHNYNKVLRHFNFQDFVINFVQLF